MCDRTGGLRRAVHHVASWRRLSSSPVRPHPQRQGPARRYYYDIDEHGQLFLSSTRIKNFTSCYKDPVFLDFFYSRLKPLEWYEGKDDESALQDLRSQGYSHLSLCGVERNYVRCDDTPIVYKELVKGPDEGGELKWHLKWAGSYLYPFEPDQLKVDERGYVYHPSPKSPDQRRRRVRQSTPQGEQAAHQYGEYSLIRSEVVLRRLSQDLDISASTGEGEFTFEEQKFYIGRLKPELVHKADDPS